MFDVLPTDQLFKDSPFTGEADCLCSRCGSAIPEDAVPIRAFVNQGHGGEYRYCDYCQEQAGVWSHDHYPVIVHRTGGPPASVVNFCGECGNRIISHLELKAQSIPHWKLAPPEGTV